MITAIDFGSFEIRAAFRSLTDSGSLTMFRERAEYAMLPGNDAYAQALQDHNISYGQCEDALTVIGNQALKVRWLSRKPCAPLFPDGTLPLDDPPARQMLSLLVASMLPPPSSEPNHCIFTVPGIPSPDRNDAFLSRLIRLQGFQPIKLSSTEAVILACGAQNAFTGATVVMGMHSSHVAVSRFGQELGAVTIPIGTDWIDLELAKQFDLRVWDEEGNSYLDLESVREWKHEASIHLRHGTSERERALGQMYGVVLDRLTKGLQELLHSPTVQAYMEGERVHVICAGGATDIGGFSSCLTERFVDHEIAQHVLSVRTVQDASTAVVRGLLIHGEVEVQRNRHAPSAA